MNYNDYTSYKTHFSIHDDIYVKNKSKYYMGWNFNSLKKKDKNNKNNKNNKIKNSNKIINNINIKDNNIKDNKIKNNLSLSSNNKLMPRQYNLYNEFTCFFPPIIDQENINCCVPISISTIYYYLTFKQNNIIKMQISSLYLYNLIKKQNSLEFISESCDSLDSAFNDDPGATIYETLKILKKKGSCPEFLYTYNKNNFTKIPDNNLLNFASKCKLLNFTKIYRFNIKQYLLNDNPVICGIKIFNSFHSDKTIRTGIIDLPHKLDYLLGGHSIVIIGFNNYIDSYIFINSWGTSWGNKGLGIIPYTYINNKDYADEFYIMNLVTNPDLLLIDNLNNKKKNIVVGVYLLLLTLFLQIKISKIF